jgi:hypothetical protein
LLLMSHFYLWNGRNMATHSHKRDRRRVIVHDVCVAWVFGDYVTIDTSMQS